MSASFPEDLPPELLGWNQPNDGDGEWRVFQMKRRAYAKAWKAEKHIF